MKHIIATAALLALASAAGAQNIERVKMTDNDLSCQQIYSEIGLMDANIAKAGQPNVAVAQVDAQGNVGGQLAGAAAQTAMAMAVSQSPQVMSGFGNALGGFGGMFGGIVSQLAQGAAQQQQASAASAQQQAAAAAANGAAMAQQAQGRKDHLTGLFLSKGCKMSDIKK